MPTFNFRGVASVADRAPLPTGTYQCRLDHIEMGTARTGKPVWDLHWVVVDGEYNGRKFYDKLYFTEKAMPRVKLLCGACGLDVSGTLDLAPNALVGKRMCVMVEVEEYEDAQGRRKARNKVPFAGYATVGDHDDDLPF